MAGQQPQFPTSRTFGRQLAVAVFASCQEASLERTSDPPVATRLVRGRAGMRRRVSLTQHLCSGRHRLSEQRSF